LKDFEEAVNRAVSFLGNEHSSKLDGPWVPFSFVKRLELKLK